MKTILLTGFEPFGGEAVNPSGEIARELNGATLARHRIVGALLPCVFGAALKELKLLLKRHQPALVTCLGLAGGRAALTPERVALNLDDARIPDNAGQQPIDRPIVRDGPVAYWSTLPLKAIVHELRRRSYPAEVSQTAGTFVCNHVFYGLMHELALHHPGVRGGFIHVPNLPEQSRDGQPSLPFELQTAALRLTLETCVHYRRDIKMVGGANS